MKKLVIASLVCASALTVTACGSSDDTERDISAETVEEPAAAAMEEVTEEPVEDPVISAPEPAEPAAKPVRPSVEAEAETAGDKAEETVADIEALLKETANDKAKEQVDKMSNKTE